MARTSQPPPADFREVYGALAAHGAPVLGIHVSGALSGTFSAARTAAGSLRADGGLAPIAVARLAERVRRAGPRRAGGRARRARRRDPRRGARGRRRERPRGRAFTPPCRRSTRSSAGGRVTAGQRALANALGVVPLLTLDRSGRARAGGASRGFPRACVKLVEKALAKTPGPRGADLGSGPLRGGPARGPHRRGAARAPAGLGRVRRRDRSRARRPHGPGGRRGGLSGLTRASNRFENDSLRDRA